MQNVPIRPSVQIASAAPPDVAETDWPGQMTAIRALAESRGAVPKGAGWHRLSGGRTNRVWKTGTDDPLVIKLYDTAAASPLFPNRPEQEAVALSAAASHGLAPRIRDRFVTPFGECLVYELASGGMWRTGTIPVAKALHAVHSLTPPSGLTMKPGGEAALRVEIRAILNSCGITQAAPLLQYLDRLQVAQMPLAAPVFLHGDPVPGNIIRRGRKLMLIDWQCAGTGDAADDLALFLSPAMQRLYRGKPLSSWESETFLAAYPDTFVISRYRALKPLFHLRMAAHCLWKSERGAAGYGRALALERAALDA
ncbi:MAG: phosphotransferase [Paracoccaceae bacterium]